MKLTLRVLCLLTMLTTAWTIANAQTVKITPLGQRTGEFCAQDRAILFEDPTGVRILYDPGNTVAGGADTRLGDIHAILVSHAHSDHLGNASLNQDPNSSSSSCASSVTVAAPNSNTAAIAAAKNSAVIAGGPLATIIARLIAATSGTNTSGCPAAGLTNEMTIPRTAPCTAGLGLGSKRTVRQVSAKQGVQISAVSAEHPNDLSSAYVADPEKTNLSSSGLGAYVGLANGFVVAFTNGLTVYLSGDTGLTADMSAVVRGYYRAELAIINIGDLFTTGPEEAAFAVNELIHAVSVIPSHVNEAATQGGVPVAGSRTERFVELVSRRANPDAADLRGRPLAGASVYLPLSGVTMEINADGRCVVGCQNR